MYIYYTKQHARSACKQRQLVSHCCGCNPHSTATRTAQHAETQQSSPVPHSPIQQHHCRAMHNVSNNGVGTMIHQQASLLNNKQACSQGPLSGKTPCTTRRNPTAAVTVVQVKAVWRTGAVSTTNTTHHKSKRHTGEAWKAQQ